MVYLECKKPQCIYAAGTLTLLKWSRSVIVKHIAVGVHCSHLILPCMCAAKLWVVAILWILQQSVCVVSTSLRVLCLSRGNAHKMMTTSRIPEVSMKWCAKYTFYVAQVANVLLHGVHQMLTNVQYTDGLNLAVFFFFFSITSCIHNLPYLYS